MAPSLIMFSMLMVSIFIALGSIVLSVYLFQHEKKVLGTCYAVICVAGFAVSANIVM